MKSIASPTVFRFSTSAELNFTPYSSSTICDSSARSSESMSSSSNVASRLIAVGSAPNVSSALEMVVSTWVASVVVDIVCVLLSGGHAAVDIQSCSGHVGGRVGGEEAHASGDLVGFAWPSRRHRLKDLGRNVLCHVSGDESRCDSVYRHALPRDLRRDRFGHPDQASLRGGV